jgi:hypothetical protein
MVPVTGLSLVAREGPRSQVNILSLAVVRKGDLVNGSKDPSKLRMPEARTVNP